MNELFPAIVREYNRVTRQCRVEIPGMTDGSDLLPLAECLQPLGDRTEDNETRIKVGDRVYVQFLAGDPRHPVIVGFRAKNVGNNIGRRFFEQENIETQADETQKHGAGTTYEINAGSDITTQAGGSQTHDAGSSYTVTADTKITFMVGGSVIEMTPAGITINGARVDIN